MTMIARRVQIANRTMSLFAIIITVDSSTKFKPVGFYSRIDDCSHRGKGLIP